MNDKDETKAEATTGGVSVEQPVGRTYGGVTLEEIQQSPRAFGEVPVIEGLCAHIAEMEAAFNEWQFDLADGADHRYQMRVHQISKTM